MSTPHLEVIPRIIDTSIAAAYQAPSETAETPTVFDKPDAPQVQQGGKVIMSDMPMTVTQKFFSTLRDYIIPILFIIAVIAIIYVLWKYWTTYRASVKDVIVVEPKGNQLEALESPPQLDAASTLDLSKYILSNESSNGDNESAHGKLSTIDELEENDSLHPLEYTDDSDEEEDEEDASDDDDEEEEEESDSDSVASVPDFSVISNLINQPIDEYANDRFEYLNDDADSVQGHLDTEETHMDDEEPQPVTKTTKRAKKSKRVVL